MDPKGLTIEIKTNCIISELIPKMLLDLYICLKYYITYILIAVEFRPGEFKTKF